jgi:hypothetical protein
MLGELTGLPEVYDKLDLQQFTSSSPAVGRGNWLGSAFYSLSLDGRGKGEGEVLI